MSTVDLDQAMLDPANFDVDALVESLDDAPIVSAEPQAPQAAAPAPAAQPQPSSEPAGDTTKGATPAAQAPEEPKPAQPEPTPIGVLTKDGKHVIPYAAIEAERTRASNAERARQVAEQLANQEASTRRELEAKLAQMQAQLANPQPTPAGQKPAAAEVLDQATREALLEEAPAVVKLFDQLSAGLKEAQERAQRAEQAAMTVAQQRAQEEERIAASNAEAIVANDPKLSYLRATNPNAFNVIADIDDANLKSPVFANLPPAERVQKSLAMYEAAFGQIVLPGASSAAPAPTVNPSVAAQQAIARASANGGAAAPHTLSDIPGGALPPRSEAESMSELSPDQLVNKFMGMTDEQIDRVLARTT